MGEKENVLTGWNEGDEVVVRGINGKVLKAMEPSMRGARKRSYGQAKSFYEAETKAAASKGRGSQKRKLNRKRR